MEWSRDDTLGKGDAWKGTDKKRNSMDKLGEAEKWRGED